MSPCPWPARRSAWPEGLRRARAGRAARAAAAHARPEVATPTRLARRRAARTAAGSAWTCARRCGPAAGPAGTRCGRCAAAGVPRPAAGRAVRHLGLDGAVRARLPAVPARRGRRGRRGGLRLRDAADPADARAARAPARPRARARAGRRARTGRAARGSARRWRASTTATAGRGMARGAVVVIVSDGWDRGDPALLGREMARLPRLAYRIVWVNPRKAAPGFAPRSAAWRRRCRTATRSSAGNSLAALGEVIEAIGARRRRRPWSSRTRSWCRRRSTRSGTCSWTSSASRRACPAPRCSSRPATTPTRSRSRSGWARCR